MAARDVTGHETGDLRRADGRASDDDARETGRGLRVSAGLAVRSGHG